MKITKTLLLLLFLIIISSSCSKSYFEFDSIEHYYRDLSNDEIMAIYNSQDKSEKRLLILDIIENRYPEEIDNSFGEILIKNKYKKSNISQDKLEPINDIFSENICLVGTASACIPVYRDILIFKKNNKVVGIAKICFDCEISHIIGTAKNTEDFGQCGDYANLFKMLH